MSEKGILSKVGEAFKKFFCSLLSKKPRNSTNKYNTTNLQCTGGWIVWGTILMFFFILALSFGWGALIGFFLFMLCMTPWGQLFINILAKGVSKAASKIFFFNLPYESNNKVVEKINSIKKKLNNTTSTSTSIKSNPKSYYFSLMIILICIILVSIKLGVLSKKL